MSIYTFITQAYRYSEGFDASIRTLFPTARQVEIDSYLTNQADADSVSSTLWGLLKVQRQLFEVPVLGVNVIFPSQFGGAAVCATLYENRFNLTNGKLVVIVGFTLDLNQGQTTLQCWG